MEEVVATLVVEVEEEEVTVMGLLLPHPAPDIQVLLAAEAVAEATLVVEVVEDSLVEEVEEVVEATVTDLLPPHQAPATLHPRAQAVLVLTQPLHQAQAPPMDLPLEGVVACPAMAEEVVVEVEEEEEEDMGEVVDSHVLRCPRRAASKFPNKWQFRWDLTRFWFH